MIKKRQSLLLQPIMIIKTIVILLFSLVLLGCNKPDNAGPIFQGAVKNIKYTELLEYFGSNGPVVVDRVVEIKEGKVDIFKEYVLVTQPSGVKTYILNKNLITISFD